MNETFDIRDLPLLSQRQDDLNQQLADLHAAANRLGMYDAADAVRQIYGNTGRIKYGCHCDLEPDMEPDDCVIDEGRPQDCVHAKLVGRKERCGYWRVVADGGGDNNESTVGERAEQ